MRQSSEQIEMERKQLDGRFLEIDEKIELGARLARQGDNDNRHKFTG